jgi:S1-C subfamily serine protease
MYETWRDLAGPDMLGSRTFLFFVDGKLAGWNSNGDARRVLANLDQPITEKKRKFTGKPKSTSKVSTGTGFFINKNGYLVTNNHVIETCDSIYVKEFGPARKITSDKINDIAILKVNKGPSTFAKIRGTQKVSLGETVIVYGFPYAGTLSQDGNLTEGNVSALSGFQNDIRMYQISAPIQPGNSGGPLLDSSINVIGIVTAKFNAIAMANITGDIPQNVNFAMKSDILKSILDLNGIDFKQANLSKQSNLVEIAKKAKNFTSLIVCE